MKRLNFSIFPNKVAGMVVYLQFSISVIRLHQVQCNQITQITLQLLEQWNSFWFSTTNEKQRVLQRLLSRANESLLAVIRPSWCNEPSVSPLCVSSEMWLERPAKAIRHDIIEGVFYQRKAGRRIAMRAHRGDSSDVTATGARVCTAQIRPSSHNNCVIATAKVAFTTTWLLARVFTSLSLSFAVI